LAVCDALKIGLNADKRWKVIGFVKKILEGAAVSTKL